MFSELQLVAGGEGLENIRRGDIITIRYRGEKIFCQVIDYDNEREWMQVQRESGLRQKMESEFIYLIMIH